MKLGTIIKEYRISHNLNQQQFADRCKLSRQTIGRIENGNIEFDQIQDHTLSVLAKAMDTTTSSLNKQMSLESDEEGIYLKPSDVIKIYDSSYSEEVSWIYLPKHEGCFGFFVEDDSKTIAIVKPTDKIKDSNSICVLYDGKLQLATYHSVGKNELVVLDNYAESFAVRDVEIKGKIVSTIYSL